MVLRTSKANGHIHTYSLGSRVTSMDNGHNHLMMMGSTLTSINQGHSHALINLDRGIISINGK